MGINITEIAQKVLDNNKNAANVFRKMYDLHYNPNPLDVPFEYIDENGNKVTTTIKNVAGFRKKVWDDIGGALGQFYRVFYVDAVNGNDNNTGSSSAPFKTIEKALIAAPYGGFTNIRLKTKQNYKFTEDYAIVLENKAIWINAWDAIETDDDKPLITFDTYIDDTYTDITSLKNRLAVGRFCYLQIDNVKFDIPEQIDADHPYSTVNYLSFPIRLDGALAVTLNYCEATLNNSKTNASILMVTGYRTNPSINLYNNKFIIDDDSNFVIRNRYDSVITLNLRSNTIVDSNGNNKTLSNTLSNIARDADSGNPVNVISNINFSS